MRLATRSLWLALAAVSLLFAGLPMQSQAGKKVKRPIATGKDFYIVFPKATWGNQSVGVLINSPSKQTITITTPTGQKGRIKIPQPRFTQYYAGQFRIESDPEVVKRKEATRIQSENPISVHGQFGIGGISGTYTAIPVSAWGLEYYAIAPPEGTNTGYYYYPTIYSVPMITIIGSHDGTSVTIVPTSPTAKGHAQDVPYTVTLNRGDVYNITTPGDPKANPRVEDPCNADLTGTHILANFPVGVLTAQTHNTWPCGDNECGDYCVEFIPPVCNWDSTYVITPSVPRQNGADGEGIRVVFGHDGTDLIVDDGASAPRNMGTFAAGQYFDYPSPLVTNAIIMSGSHPFLPVEITKKPAGCFVGTSGGENWTLGMVVLSGVHQWGDYTPFSTAVGSQSVANVFFKYSERNNIKLNGKQLMSLFPTVKILPQGYATVPIPINAGQYNELTGDSGATAGGSIFGYGTLRFGVNDGSGEKHVLDPEVIKSFAHPIGVNALAACNPDITPPHDTITYSCGHWDVSAYDDELNPPATGMYDVYLAYNSPPDSSYNVVFNPLPAFQYGDTRAQFGIDVVNLAQPAQAALHLRDGAGNEYDTVLVYTPQIIDARPTFLDVGAIRSGDSTTGTITLHNRSALSARIESYRLRFGNTHHWKIIPPSPSIPYDLPAGDSVKFTFQYNSPITSNLEYDDDTLLITTCKEFPIAALLGQPKKPGIFTECYDFGNAIIDTLASGGDTLSSLSAKHLWVTSISSDTLHITGMEIIGSVIPPEPGYPGTDFRFGTKFFLHHGKTVSNLTFPTATNAWLLAPKDTAFVEVIGHPHHSGLRPANVHFINDANGVLQDTACVQIFGLAPGIVARSVDYGTHLYATTVDSFFVIRNSGQTVVTVKKNGFHGDPSSDTNAFIFHTYRDTVNQSNVYYSPAVDNDLSVGDTTRVPYRFIASKLGQNTLNISIENSTKPLGISLTGIVIQPHIYGVGAAAIDSTFLGGTQNQDVLVANVGTSPLTIQRMQIGGAGVTQWDPIGPTTPIKNKVTNQALALPFTLQIGDTAVVTVTYRPTKVGPAVASVSFTGADYMGRHAADSAANTTYRWSTFPYDTTVPIKNLAYASGIATRDLHLETYVTLVDSGKVYIRNTGQGPIVVSNITTTSADEAGGYISFTTDNALPFNIPPQDSVPVYIRFSPGETPGLGIPTGRRNYSMDLVIENSTGTPITSHFTGKAYMVDMHSSVPRTYNAPPGTDVPVDVIVDKWVDSLGKCDVRGYIMEVVHYRRTVVSRDPAYNVDGSGRGSVGTSSAGAQFTENVAETEMKDLKHNNGEQGYYEVNIGFAPRNVAQAGVMMRMQFHTLIGLDTSEIVYLFKNPIDPANNLIQYINISQNPGLITVDSICGLNLNKVKFNGSLTLNQNSPNPYNGTTSIHFGQPWTGHVKLVVVNAVGDVVANLVDKDLPSGEFNVQFDGSNLPSGLYTYRLETNTGNLQKQMMLVR